VLTLVRDLSHAHGEAVNLLQILEALRRRGVVLDLALQEPRYFEPDVAVTARVRALAARTWRVGHTDHSIFWTPPRWLRAAPGRVQRVAGLLDDAVRIVPSVLGTVVHAGRRRPDVVLEVRQFGMTWSVPVARLTGAACVCQVNVVIDARPRRDGLLLAGADRVLAVSHFVKDALVDLGVPERKVRVVHNGVDPAAYPAAGRAERDAAVRALGLDPAVPVVVFYGQLNPVKGVDVLLAAARRRRRPYQLVVAGRYTDPSYRAVLDPLAADLDDVTWLDHQEDVLPLLHAADVVVLPSAREEAFGRVLIEAMSTGRPAVGSRIGGIPEVLTGELDRFLATPGDPEDLARALDAALDWRDADPGLGARCRALVEERFTLEHAAAGIEAVLREAAAERAARRRTRRETRRRRGRRALASRRAAG
jgi:glycosyltransferase involved in cell wall biosynthesis